jgi:3-hydroxyacyl-CoA dehydrogenase
VGAEHAISILIDAKVLTAVEALSIGLIDEVVENDPQSAALKRTEIGPAPIGMAHIAPGLRDPRRYFAATTSARQKYAQSRLVTPTHIVDCIDAALVLTSRQAFDLEAATADMLQSKAQSMALRYAYASEKKSVLPPDTIRAQPAPPLSVVIIWGADETAVDIAVQMLAVGLQVQIVDQNREALALVLSLIAKRQLASVNAGRMSIDAQQADWLRLTTSQSTATLQAADIVLVTQGAGPVPSFVTPARIIVLGSLDKGASGSALSILPVPSQGLTTEIGMGYAVGLTKLGLAYALLKRLKWQAVLVGQGGSVQARLQTCFAACTKSLEQRGHAATDISAALASFGIGAALRGPVSPMPDQGAKIISAFCLAMANEGLRLIQEGIAKRPSDVDVLAVASGLYPRWQGGGDVLGARLGLAWSSGGAAGASVPV